MSCDIVVTHRVFPETLTMLQKLGNVFVPGVERFVEAELRRVLSNARATMVFMPDHVDREFLLSAP